MQSVYQPGCRSKPAFTNRAAYQVETQSASRPAKAGFVTLKQTAWLKRDSTQY